MRYQASEHQVNTYTSPRGKRLTKDPRRPPKQREDDIENQVLATSLDVCDRWGSDQGKDDQDEICKAAATHFEGGTSYRILIRNFK